MKKLLLFILTFYCCLYTSVSFGQAVVPLDEGSYVDSLSRSYTKSSSDSLKAEYAFLLSEYWRNTDTAKARTYLRAGAKLAPKNQRIAAILPYYQAQFLSNNHPDSAAVYFMNTIRLLESERDPDALNIKAASWYNYAITKKDEKGYEYLIDILLNKSIPMAEQAGKTEKIAHFYTQLGTIFLYNAQFDKAKQYNDHALKLLTDSISKSSALLLAYLASVSIDVYRGHATEALPNLKKAEQLLALYPKSINYPYLYYHQGLYYTGKTQFSEALTAYDKCIERAAELEQRMLLAMASFGKYNVYLLRKDYVRGRSYLMELVKEGTLSKDANNKRTLYNQLATLNEQLGDMKAAYRWLQAYNKVNDSLHNQKVQEQINALEAKYRSAEKEKTIALLQSEKKQVSMEASNQRTTALLLGIASIFLLVAALVSFFYYRSNRRLSKQKEINHQQEVKELERQQQLITTKAILETEERERKRVAVDLHDGLGGLLAGIKMRLSGFQKKTAAGLYEEEVNSIIVQVDDAAQEVRRIAQNMMPEGLLRFGLESALKDLCETFQTKGCQVEFQSFGIAADLPLSVQTTVYRIVQELLTNMARHAEANHMLIQCSQNGSVFYITAEDDGKGFDLEQVNEHKGMGMNNLQTRVSYLNGKIDLSSEPGEGTTLNIELYVES